VHHQSTDRAPTVVATEPTYSPTFAELVARTWLMLIHNPLSTFAETQRKKPDGRFTLESFVTDRREDGFGSGRA
jgi:hypothetical protein